MNPGHIVVVGAPGAGKTTIGKALARHLDLLFVDTDAVVTKLSGREMAELFITEGEPGVRLFERQAVGDAVAGSPAVIALGSGAVLDDDVRASVAGLPVVWLRVTAPNAIARIGMNVPRPVALGNVRAQFAAMMADREPHYEQMSTVVVDTDHRPEDDIVSAVLRGLTETGVI